MSKYLVKQLLMSSNYWTLNKEVVRMFGIETAFMLSNLAEAESMMSDDEGWFYQTHETVESITGLSRHKQDVAIDKLEKEGILHKQVRGIPAKRYFKLDYEALTNNFVKKSQTRMQKGNKQECEKSATNKESNINKVNKESNDKDSQQSQKRYADDSQYMKAAVYLFEKIKERLPNKKEPDFQKWADEVRKAVELDGIPIERYKQVLDWSQNDDFWQANILSTNKLRKKFDTIYLQMQRDKKQKPQKVTFQNTRNSQEDTEITPEMMKAYEELKQNERT